MALDSGAPSRRRTRPPEDSLGRRSRQRLVERPHIEGDGEERIPQGARPPPGQLVEGDPVGP